MNINRHNYEEFFLLYIDNELSLADKSKVEAFAEENPDLKHELELLQQTKLPTDDGFIFEEKELLLKPENLSFINQTNYQEYLLLNIDGELNEADHTELEKYLDLHPQAKQEMALLQKAKLQSEAIVYPYKDELYRYENRKPVVAMRWWRLAAAAVLLIAAGTTVYKLTNTNQPVAEPVVAKTNPAPAKTVTTNVTDKQSTPVENNNSKNQITKAVTEQKQQATAYSIAKNNSEKSSKEKQDNNLATPSQERILAINQLNENISNNQKPAVEKQLINLNPTKSNNDFAVQSNPSVKQSFTKADVTSPTYASLNNQTVGDEFTLNENKNKTLRGFFRKATRFFEKTTKVNPANDDGKVLIGGVAINLK
ncbi:MAG: hypothetical protein C4308_09185 [Chitinophagaceae bacterium]